MTVQEGRNSLNMHDRRMKLGWEWIWRWEWHKDNITCREGCFLHPFHQCHYKDRSQQNIRQGQYIMVFIQIDIIWYISWSWDQDTMCSWDTAQRKPSLRPKFKWTNTTVCYRLQYATVCYSMLQYSFILVIDWKLEWCSGLNKRSDPHHPSERVASFNPSYFSRGNNTIRGNSTTYLSIYLI